MRINEAYEHDSILPSCQTEEVLSRECCKEGRQCVNISAPMTLTPTAELTTMSVSCQGTPEVTCTVNDGGTSCTVTFTQRLCMSARIRYGVTCDPASPAIACAGTDDACPTCPCI